MKINRITISNFRNIGKKCSYFLNPSVTVFIGINGKGKSTVLDAIRIACGAYFLAIPEVKKRHIRTSEIRVVDVGMQLIEQRPVLVEAEGVFPETQGPVIWRRQILEGSNVSTSSKEDVGIIRMIGQQRHLKMIKEGVGFDENKTGLPVIAYFGTNRSISGSRTIKSKIGKQIFKEGYQDWNDMKSLKYSYESWLSSYDILKKNNKEYPETKNAFLTALKTANRYIADLEVVSGRLWLKIKMDDYESELLPLELHSDGVRFFTELVAETAYRCIILNGQMDEAAVTSSQGVVMIDELDLHLHPNWQRHVVQDLTKAFPNIQFVVTTHSTFIVQSLKSDELIILDELIKKDGDPFRKSIEEVAANEMGVDDVPRSAEFMEMERVAEEYYKLIENGKSSDKDSKTRELRSRLNELEERYGEDPAFVAALKVERLAHGL